MAGSRDAIGTSMGDHHPQGTPGAYAFSTVVSGRSKTRLQKTNALKLDQAR